MWIKLLYHNLSTFSFLKKKTYIFVLDLKTDLYKKIYLSVIMFSLVLPFFFLKERKRAKKKNLYTHFEVKNGFLPKDMFIGK